VFVKILGEHCYGKWINYDGSWLVILPDLTPLDFLLLHFTKDGCYVPPIPNSTEMLNIPESQAIQKLDKGTELYGSNDGTTCTYTCM
jgi:hypothetical protein